MRSGEVQAHMRIQPLNLLTTKKSKNIKQVVIAQKTTPGRNSFAELHKRTCLKCVRLTHLIEEGWIIIICSFARLARLRSTVAYQAALGGINEIIVQF